MQCNPDKRKRKQNKNGKEETKRNGGRGVSGWLSFGIRRREAGKKGGCRLRALEVLLAR